MTGIHENLFAGRFPDYTRTLIPNLPEDSAGFEACFKNFGGRHEIGANERGLLGPEWFKRRYWDYLRTFRQVMLYRNALRDAYFDYIENMALNAAVGFSGERPFIGLCLGAFHHLATFFQVLLSHPAVFPDVGDPSKQISWFEDLSAWNWSLSVGLALKNFESSQRTKPEFAKGKRSVFAGYLTMFALDFVFFHEIGHWCKGHDRVAAKMKSTLTSVNELESFHLPAIPNQLLELDADSFAVVLMTNEWFQAPFGPKSIFRSPSEALRIWTIAIVFTFILIGQERKINIVRPIGLHPHPQLIGHHPHPMMRLENAHQALTVTARLFSTEALAMMERAWDEGLQTAVAVCEQLRIPSNIWVADSETVHRTYQALSLEWAAIYEPMVDSCSRLSPSTKSTIWGRLRSLFARSA